MTKTTIIDGLLQANAIQISPNEPFTYASGILSPIYTDLRVTISYPQLRRQIATGLAELIAANFPEATVIGGVATAGIPHAAWVAAELDLPMVYVRSKPKDHGTGKQIEGKLTKDDQVVLIDDLISTGGSVLGAVKAVRDFGADVAGVAAIYSYELPDADQNFAAADTKLVHLTGFSTLVGEMEQTHRLSDDDLQILKNWHAKPWGKKREEDAKND
ncbi:orotate phosphoribosyltransferase [Lactobacillus selangorensis]|uniref:Orotate phosphoribosyltransferase n=1 Tax=Lactobacillus selangorensis TaxID=81857 RepID=A0A0R2FJ33_9LACO|nr:orotate phosphoribosyltransferase [Lactobacillus selangorensis]KRN28671.1 orotate phosphoribosyltransferase [Lactobacillus selangorensis]KRN32919.1 orotate phosphoribosyltransferase [Lactobacillus selangorensis]